MVPKVWIIVTVRRRFKKRNLIMIVYLGYFVGVAYEQEALFLFMFSKCVRMEN